MDTTTTTINLIFKKHVYMYFYDIYIYIYICMIYLYICMYLYHTYVYGVLDFGDGGMCPPPLHHKLKDESAKRFECAGEGADAMSS